MDCSRSSGCEDRGGAGAHGFGAAAAEHTGEGRRPIADASPRPAYPNNPCREGAVLGASQFIPLSQFNPARGFGAVAALETVLKSARIQKGQLAVVCEALTGQPARRRLSMEGRAKKPLKPPATVSRRLHSRNQLLMPRLACSRRPMPTTCRGAAYHNCIHFVQFFVNLRSRTSCRKLAQFCSSLLMCSL